MKYSREQAEALLEVYNRNPDKSSSVLDGRIETFKEFSERSHLDNIMGCVLIAWSGMVLGIEVDGYIHS